MAHHAPTPNDDPGHILPRSTAARVVLVTVSGVLAGAVTLATWAMGGLARASDADRVLQPGSPMKNTMFTLTPHEAVSSAGAGPEGTPGVEVRAELTSHDDEPFRLSELRSTIEADLSPGGTPPDEFSLVFERAPELPVTSIQPHMPETVLMRWPLPSGGSVPEELEEITVAVSEAEHKPGFADRSSRWFATSDTAAEVTLPVTQE
ncbi:hypothetical protein [Haloactinospora alba]|uniref:hypothetical protein n=1 Tax=Haloactinospora alba TaxID=405555 RepID=UPI001151D2E3|nr:hypothetical protein [Haloactinospora alba]